MPTMNTAETPTTIAFDQAQLWATQAALDESALDALGFGVIGFDAAELVQRYNATESRLAALGRRQVLGLPLFGVVAPCMDTALVAQRFHDARAQGQALDLTLDYVLTLRMRPTPVRLRLLAAAADAPPGALRFVCVQR